MNGFKQICLALAMAGVLASSMAQAALEDRGGGLIYDNVLDITWLADANYAATQFAATGGAQGDADGRMNWTAANAWAANLTFHDSVRNVDLTGWRLPTALNQDGTAPCIGFGCNSSEMGHLFYTDGGLSPDQSITESANLNSYFTNMQSDVYWSGTAYAPYPAYYAWYFKTVTGYQYLRNPSNEFYAWAVRPGDVAAPIPEPETYAMLLAGLGLLGVVAKRKKSA